MTRRSTYMCSPTTDEMALFMLLAMLARVSRNDPTYELAMRREFGPGSWRVLRDMPVQGHV